MTPYEQRPFSRSDLPQLITLVSHNAANRLPGCSYLLNSDVLWRLPGSDPKENIRLWYDQKTLKAFAWFEPGEPLSFDLDVSIRDQNTLISDIIHWFELRTKQLPAYHPWTLDLTSMTDWQAALSEGKHQLVSDQHHLQIISLESDRTRIESLLHLGFKPSNHFAYALQLDLTLALETPNLPKGMSVRHIEAEDFEARVAVHRDAWFNSSYNMEQYLGHRSLPGYQPDLDLVIVDQTGEFVCYCVGWIDAYSGIGSIEPLGCKPAFRGLGLNQQMILSLLHRFKDHGMRTAKIGTAGFNAPAFKLYSRCGFKLIDKERTYVKQLV